MFKKNGLIAMTALVFLGFIIASTANAEEPKCYTLASLQGSYASIATYSANVALALARRYFDGKGNLTGTFLINAPVPGSTTGARKIIKGTQKGMYTVNCDGTGVFTRDLTQPDGTVTHSMDDFVITKAKVDDGRFVATAMVDAQRVPSQIIPGGLFVTHSFTRLPDQPGPDADQN
jgi:hypothetical protein